MERGLKQLRTKYAGIGPAARPASIEEKSWAVFLAYFHDGQSLKGIGARAGLSPAQVSHTLYEVDARLSALRRTEPEGAPVTLESAIEALALSLRARNALHSLGCDRVRDVLAMDLSAARGMGQKTLGEVRTALRISGFPHPELDEPLDTEIRSLNRSLERLQIKLTAALEAVAKEISQVQKRLRKRMREMGERDSGHAEAAAPAWPPTHIAETPRDGDRSYE